jgi:hypothetical protein
MNRKFEIGLFGASELKAIQRQRQQQQQQILIASI